MEKQKLAAAGNGEVLPANGQQRRKFLSMIGLTAGAATVLSSCQKYFPGSPFDPKNPDGGMDLGTGDTGILNYAYLLEQLEAAFYIQVIKTPYNNISDYEKAMLTDIRDHELAHRELFKAALATSAIPKLDFNFSSVNFKSRDSVLATSKAFEDLGVSAYNGAGRLIGNPDYLTLAGKIVSVEARHAAFIRDLISNGSFAGSDVVDANGLDKSRTPLEVLVLAAPYIKIKVNGYNLPKK